MNLPDAKALEKLIKLLRAQGVLQYQTADLNLVLSEHSQITSNNRKSRTSVTEEAQEDYLDIDEDPAAEIERLVDYSSRSPIEDL